VIQVNQMVNTQAPTALVRCFYDPEVAGEFIRVDGKIFFAGFSEDRLGAYPVMEDGTLGELDLSVCPTMPVELVAGLDLETDKVSLSRLQHSVRPLFQAFLQTPKI
jgi:hypothetical protein